MKCLEGFKGSHTTTFASNLNTETHTEPLIRKPSQENESVLNKQTVRKKKTQRKSEASNGVIQTPGGLLPDTELLPYRYREFDMS